MTHPKEMITGPMDLGDLGFLQYGDLKTKHNHKLMSHKTQ